MLSNTSLICSISTSAYTGFSVISATKFRSCLSAIPSNSDTSCLSIIAILHFSLLALLLSIPLLPSLPYGFSFLASMNILCIIPLIFSTCWNAFFMYVSRSSSLSYLWLITTSRYPVIIVIGVFISCERFVISSIFFLAFSRSSFIILPILCCILSILYAILVISSRPLLSICMSRFPFDIILTTSERYLI